MDSELGERDLTVSESFNENGRDGYKITARPQFFTEQFERVCPYYIAFGMTYAEFWDGECEIAKAYRQAHEIKLREQNQFAWLQGAYVYQAVGALAPALKAFAKGQAQEYMKEPFAFETSKDDPKPKEKQSDTKAKKWLEMWAISFNAKFDKKILAEGGETDG